MCLLTYLLTLTSLQYFATVFAEHFALQHLTMRH